MNFTEDHSKTIYRQQIHQLKQLQSIDDKIVEEKTRLEEAPKELEALEHQFKSVSEQRDSILDKIALLRDQDARLRREIEDKSARLEKSRNKIMEASNEREYDAVNREISTIEDMSQSGESERVAILDELTTQNDRLAEIESQYNAINAQLEESRKTISVVTSEANANLAVLAEQRQACSEAIPNPIFRRYEFIRARLENPVVVPLRDYVCPSCHIAVPPQTFNDLLRGEQILNCPNCQRLIVWSNDYYADDPEGAAAYEQAQLGSSAGGSGGVTTFFEDAYPGGKHDYGE